MPFACVVFTRALWFTPTDAPCRDCFLCDSPSRARRSVHSCQIPSRRDAPRHSPPEPEHLPPRSLALPSRREPPHPVWFGHQPKCFRHIRHALRCALGRRPPWLQSLENDGRVPLLGFCQFNVPRAHHEHRRAPTSATGQLPASDDRMPKHVALRFRCFVRRLRSAGHPLRGVIAVVPHRGCSASHGAWHCGPHPHLDDRSSRWIYPRWRWSGHLMSPADARVRLEERTERRCGCPSPRNQLVEHTRPKSSTP
jgi:hypothetical protein